MSQGRYFAAIAVGLAGFFALGSLTHRSPDPRPPEAAPAVEEASSASAPPAETDHFHFDPAKAQRSAMYRRDMDKMAACVAEYTPQMMGAGSRKEIRDNVGGACLSDIVADGFVDDPTGRRIVGRMIDREIDALLPAGQ